MCSILICVRKNMPKTSNVKTFLQTQLPQLTMGWMQAIVYQKMKKHFVPYSPFPFVLFWNCDSREITIHWFQTIFFHLCSCPIKYHYYVNMSKIYHKIRFFQHDIDFVKHPKKTPKKPPKSPLRITYNWHNVKSLQLVLIDILFN